jgi:eukaryotic-like serine/threonine-protein kinase
VASIKTMNFDHLVGQQVGTSVLLKKLDNGAMSVVFVAFQKSLKRQIAVKILPKALLTAKVADLFQQEAESAAFLSHPCIIPIYEVGQTDDFLFFTMQMVKGRSLAYYITRARKNVVPSKRMLPVRPSLKIIVKVLDALDYANNTGIIHRDIKPGNVLIEDHSKRPVITDFGVARSYGGSGDDTRMLVGTPTYMAPEQIVSNLVDGQADVYAAGVMLFEMLAGRLPYPPYDSAIKLLKIKLRLKDRIFLNKPSEMNRLVDADLDDIVFKAVAYDKERRYATCREFANDVEAYLKRHQ